MFEPPTHAMPTACLLSTQNYWGRFDCTKARALSSAGREIKFTRIRLEGSRHRDGRKSATALSFNSTCAANFIFPATFRVTVHADGPASSHQWMNKCASSKRRTKINASQGERMSDTPATPHKQILLWHPSKGLVEVIVPADISPADLHAEMVRKGFVADELPEFARNICK